MDTVTIPIARETALRLARLAAEAGKTVAEMASELLAVGSQTAEAESSIYSH